MSAKTSLHKASTYLICEEDSIGNKEDDQALAQDLRRNCCETS